MYSFALRSQAEPKGSDCYDAFKSMQDCMQKYPTIYGDKDKPVEETEIELAAAREAPAADEADSKPVEDGPTPSS